MPKGVEDNFKPSPVRTEDVSGYNPLGPRDPVNVPLDAKQIPQFRDPNALPPAEVIVEVLSRGVQDRNFIFAVGARYGTTWESAEKLAGRVKIIEVITEREDADAT